MAETPFEVQDDMTDVTFLVEKKRLHFNKTILALCSPVFMKMFFSDFKEKKDAQIPLPDKKYSDIVTFLEQMHPCYSIKPISDDVLERLLELSDEYQVDHIHKKCQQYISTQIDLRGRLPTDQVLFYLLMCEKYNIQDPRYMLLCMAANNVVSELECKPHFMKLPDSAKFELMKIRCLQFEERDCFSVDRALEQAVMTKKATMFDMPTVCFNALPDTCHPSCYPCPHGNYSAHPMYAIESGLCFSRRCDKKECRVLKKKSFCKRCVGNMLKNVSFKLKA